MVLYDWNKEIESTLQASTTNAFLWEVTVLSYISILYTHILLLLFCCHPEHLRLSGTDHIPSKDDGGDEEEKEKGDGWLESAGSFLNI